MIMPDGGSQINDFGSLLHFVATENEKPLYPSSNAVLIGSVRGSKLTTSI
jgi:hypothetical protein